MLIASGAGGGYDTYARALAHAHGSHIPGNPAIVRRTRCGRGRLIAANTLYNSSAPRMGSPSRRSRMVLRWTRCSAKSARASTAQKFGWLGSHRQARQYLHHLARNSPLTRIDQAKAREITVGASGAGGNSSIMPKILNQSSARSSR
jgi:tripartite-type tricarboxylate transporter receptor subunit TctC